MFTEQNTDGVVYMTSEIIPFPHLFTTRVGGVSSGYLKSLNLIGGHGDQPENIRENFRRVAAILGAGPDDCAVTKQIHSSLVRVVTTSDRHTALNPVPYDADALVTVEPELPIFCFTADCVPVLLCDPVHRIIAAAHCGWHGSVGGILGHTVDKMTELGASPECILAAIGPAIGICCFETHRDVPDAVRAWLGSEAAEPYILPHPEQRDKYFVDLKGANASRLCQLGLSPNHIDISDECTRCKHDKYWSHRFAGAKRGGQCAAIVLPGDHL